MDSSGAEACEVGGKKETWMNGRWRWRRIIRAGERDQQLALIKDGDGDGATVTSTDR